MVGAGVIGVGMVVIVIFNISFIYFIFLEKVFRGILFIRGFGVIFGVLVVFDLGYAVKVCGVGGRGFYVKVS